MKKYKLSALQRGYLSGRNIKNRLGGVPCHVYIEAGGKSIDYQQLCRAWEKVLMRHPLLRCKAENLTYLTETENSPNSRVLMFDNSGMTEKASAERRKTIRNVFSGRFMRVEYGHTCGLGLIREPDGRDILMFDFDLTVGDVYSFQIILADLARYYGGDSFEGYVEPYMAEKDTMSGKAVSVVAGLLVSFRMSLVGNPDSMYSCRYESVRFSLPAGIWEKIAEKIHGNITGDCVWKAVSALTVHSISGMDDFLMNVPNFRSDMKSVSENTMLYIVRSDKRECNTFGEYVSRLSDEIEKWKRGEYPDGFDYEMQIQKQAPKKSWTAPIVFSSTEGMLLLTAEFEEKFGTLEYMVSQTPQVWIDMQLFSMTDSTEVYWMIPEGLLSGDIIEEMSKVFKELTERLRTSELPSEENI